VEDEGSDLLGAESRADEADDETFAENILLVMMLISLAYTCESVDPPAVSAGY
jgi:hypothetical protein